MADLPIFPATALCGSRILRALVVSRLWMEHGRGIRAWDICGLQHIPGAGCRTTTETGCMRPALAGAGSQADLIVGTTEFTMWGRQPGFKLPRPLKAL